MDGSSLVDLDTDQLATEIQNHSNEAANEEELKQRVEYILRSQVFDDWDIGWASYEHRDEVTGKRKDAVYGSVIIEYKAPGRLSTQQRAQKFSEQLKGYIKNAADSQEEYSEFMGILFDGENIAFLTFERETWRLEGPLSTNGRTIRKLLQAIRSLQRKPLNPDFLLRDFGPKSSVSKETVGELYHRLDDDPSERTLMLFQDWRRVFSQVCSYSLGKIEGLVDQYDVDVDEQEVDVERLLFAVHTYYTLLMKLLTSEIVTLYTDRFMISYLSKLETAFLEQNDRMRDELAELEGGGIFDEVGINNFLEADYFGWYLDEWDTSLENRIHEIVTELQDYEPATIELRPEEVRDLFKRLYQNLVPKKIRHDLGEYFTPDWLAQYIIDETGWDGNPNERLLDPCCGSGTFLTLAIRQIREYQSANGLDESELLSVILQNVRGIDLNPLAVLATKANYLIALSDLLRYHDDEIDLPIYLADSIMTKRRMTLHGNIEYEFETAAGTFNVHEDLVSEGEWEELLDHIDHCVKNLYSQDQFENYLSKRGRSEETVEQAAKLYDQFLELEKQDKDEIWTQVIKNSYAPLLMENFDYVVGNSPWVNWHSLPEHYREGLEPILKEYDLWHPAERHGKSGIDISSLFTYRCMDTFLKDDGRMGFLITEALLKTGAGERFRSFSFGKTKLHVSKAYDFVDLNPFEGANNKTAGLVLEKGHKTEYPLPYSQWSHDESIKSEDSLEAVRSKCQIVDLEAVPSDDDDDTSAWLTLPEEAAKAVRKARGQSHYQAYRGVGTGGTNAVFWVDIQEVISEEEREIRIPSHLLNVFDAESRLVDITVKDLLVENVTIGMKKDVKKVEKVIEDFFVYPLIKTRHFGKWELNDYIYALQMHDPIEKIGYDENWVSSEFPKTYSYLMSFESDLKARKSSMVKRLMEKGPIYCMYGVGEYTFAPYKVVWNRMGTDLNACVISTANDEIIGEKLVLPESALAFMSFYQEEAAYFVCGIINSEIPNLTIRSIAGGSKSLGSPKTIENTLNIPEYDPDNDVHTRLASLSREAHEVAGSGSGDDLERIEENIKETVANLYNITPEENAGISRALEIIQK